ncbi:hypothetical protein Tco_0333336, partial [Tanacetum coccineum]
MTLNDFRRIFHLPQAIDNNHERFVAALKARDKYHNLEDDVMVKNLFNSGKHKDDVGMKIPSWMITDEIKLMDHYQMYDVVFGVDFPMTQSHPIESTQGNRDELEAKKNVQKVKEHLITEEIKKLVEGVDNVENVEVNSSILRQDDTQNILETRLEPRSDKESPEVEITAEVQPVNIDEEEESQQRMIMKIMEDSLPTMVDDRVKELTKTQVPIYVAQGLIMDDPHDDAHLEGENGAKKQKTSKHRTFVFGESSFGQDFESEQDDDEIPTEKVLQELIDEMSHTVDEAKLHKVVDEMLRQRCTLGDKLQ